MKRGGLLLLAVLLACGTERARADAAGDWAEIVALDHGAPSGAVNSREEARTAALAYMQKQEQALRAFEAAYPDDPHVFEAELHLAHLLAVRSDLEGSAQGRREAEAIFARLPAKYPDRKTDVEFARLSLYMQNVDTTSNAARNELLARVRKFTDDHPADHRVAALLAETAGVFQGKTARALLEQARPLARDEETRDRIDDDLKRLGLLGQPLHMKWTALDGRPVNVEKMGGKVVLIYFFASWSAPSMAELGWVRQVVAAYDPGRVQALGICLDSDPVTVPAVLHEHAIDWPVYCDGAGWTGPLVRGFGINALPTLWVVDRNGVLRALNAKQEAAALVGQLVGAGR